MSNPFVFKRFMYFRVEGTGGGEGADDISTKKYSVIVLL